MSDYLQAHAADGPVEALVRDCMPDLARARANGHKLGFVYATSPLASEFGRLVGILRQETGIECWVGTVGQGICATGLEVFERPAVVALTCRIMSEAFRLLPPVDTPAQTARARDPRFLAGLGIVHGDPRNGAIGEVVAGLAEASGAYLVGGLSSADAGFPQAAGGEVIDGVVSGVLLGPGGPAVSVGLTQGCTPIGPLHTIDGCQEGVIIQLDGRPALDVLRDDVGAAPDADPRRWLANIHAAIPVAGSDRADYLVRNLTGIGPEQGLIAIAEQLQSGDRVMFVRRDQASAARDLERMLADLGARRQGTPKAGLYFSCLARGPNLFEEEAFELKAIRRAFGDIPIAGFFGNGEIAHDRLYGYTGVLTLFS